MDMGLADDSSPKSLKPLLSEEPLRYWIITFHLKVCSVTGRS